jgi:hypothetical protein
MAQGTPGPNRRASGLRTNAIAGLDWEKYLDVIRGRGDPWSARGKARFVADGKRDLSFAPGRFYKRKKRPCGTPSTVASAPDLLLGRRLTRTDVQESQLGGAFSEWRTIRSLIRIEQRTHNPFRRNPQKPLET